MAPACMREWRRPGQSSGKSSLTLNILDGTASCGLRAAGPTGLAIPLPFPEVVQPIPQGVVFLVGRRPVLGAAIGHAGLDFLLPLRVGGRDRECGGIPALRVPLLPKFTSPTRGVAASKEIKVTTFSPEFIAFIKSYTDETASSRPPMWSTLDPARGDLPQNGDKIEAHATALLSNGDSIDSVPQWSVVQTAVSMVPDDGYKTSDLSTPSCAGGGRTMLVYDNIWDGKTKKVVLELERGDDNGKALEVTWIEISNRLTGQPASVSCFNPNRPLLPKEMPAPFSFAPGTSIRAGSQEGSYEFLELFYKPRRPPMLGEEMTRDFVLSAMGPGKFPIYLCNEKLTAEREAGEMRLLVGVRIAKRGNLPDAWVLLGSRPNLVGETMFREFHDPKRMLEFVASMNRKPVTKPGDEEAKTEELQSLTYTTIAERCVLPPVIGGHGMYVAKRGWEGGEAVDENLRTELGLQSSDTPWASGSTLTSGMPVADRFKVMFDSSPYRHRTQYRIDGMSADTTIFGDTKKKAKAPNLDGMSYDQLTVLEKELYKQWDELSDQFEYWYFGSGSSDAGQGGESTRRDALEEFSVNHNEEPIRRATLITGDLLNVCTRAGAVCECLLLIFDDTVLDKNFSHKIELVRLQYSGNAHGLIKGIGLVNCVYVNPETGQYWVIDYRIYDPVTSGRVARSS
jgi:hypothetical protein